MNREKLLTLREITNQHYRAGEVEKYFPAKTPYFRLVETAEEFPGKNALMYFGKNTSYKEMLALVNQLADGFHSYGIKKGDVVATSLLATPYGVMSIYALIKIGAVLHLVNCASNIDELRRELNHLPGKYFLLNDIFYSEEIEKLLSSMNYKTIFTTSLTDGMPLTISSAKVKYSLVEFLKGVKKSKYNKSSLVSLKSVLDAGTKCTSSVNPSTDLDGISTIAYTSGSTGEAKAVIGTNRGIDSAVLMAGLTDKPFEPFLPGDVSFTSFPLWIYYSLVNMIHEMLGLGVAVAMDPLFKPENVDKINRLYRFNHWQTMPPYIKTIISANKRMDCTAWKRILTGGDFLPLSTKSSMDEYIKQNSGSTTLEQGYGATELLGGVILGDSAWKPTPGTIGKPVYGTFVKIVDLETNKELGINQIGACSLKTYSTRGI